jgi:hypothetical protein
MSFMRLPIFIGSPRKPIAKLGQTVIRRLALYGFDGFWRFRRKGQRDGARFHCASLKIGGRMGWSLPSVHGLANLVDHYVSPGLMDIF